MFLFRILINAAGFREKIMNTGKVLTGPLSKRKPMKKIHLKFIDDMTAAESINLKEKLVNNPEQNPIRPLNFHDRTKHILPQDESTVQLLLDDINSYAEDHQMQIKHEKTKVILFKGEPKSKMKKIPQHYWVWERWRKKFQLIWSLFMAAGNFPANFCSPFCIQLLLSNYRTLISHNPT